MLEEQIFYWTGAVLWIALCVGVSATAIVGCVVAPLFALKQIKQQMWKWKYIAEVADSGFTQHDLKYAISSSLPEGYELTVILEWVKKVKQRGEVMKNWNDR